MMVPSNQQSLCLVGDTICAAWETGYKYSSTCWRH